MKKLLWIGLCLVYGSVLTAQIVNIEDRRQDADSLGWMGQVDLGGGFTEYSSSIVRLNAALRIEHIGVKNNWLLLSNYTLVKSAKNKVLNDGFVHLRFNRLIGEKTRWEAFVQTQFNELLNLGIRQLIGTGPRIQWADRPSFAAYSGLLYMFEYDEFVNTENEFRDHRLSAYLSVVIRPNQNINFASTTYYQPLISDLASSRLSTSNTLAFSISDHLSFNTRFTLTYDSLLAREVGTIPNTTFAWTNGLRLSF